MALAEWRALPEGAQADAVGLVVDTFNEGWPDGTKQDAMVNVHLISAFIDAAAVEKYTKGRERMSAWKIVQNMRWDTGIIQIGKMYKISNDFQAEVARIVMHLLPEFTDFFPIKPSKKREEQKRVIAARKLDSKLRNQN